MSDHEIHNRPEEENEPGADGPLEAGDGDEAPTPASESTHTLTVPTITITPPQAGGQDVDEVRPVKKQNKNLLMLPDAEVDEDEPLEDDPEPRSRESIPDPEPSEATEEHPPVPPVSYTVEVLYPVGDHDYSRAPPEPESVDSTEAAPSHSIQMDPIPEEPENRATESEPTGPESEPLETSATMGDDDIFKQPLPGTPLRPRRASQESEQEHDILEPRLADTPDAEGMAAHESEPEAGTLTLQELEDKMLPYGVRGQSCSDLEPFIRELAKISPEQAAMHACWRNFQPDSDEDPSLPEKFYPEDFGSPKETLHEIPAEPEPRTYINAVSASTSYAVQDMNAMLESIPQEFTSSADSVGLPPVFHPSDQSVEDNISRPPAIHFSDPATNMRTCPAVPVELKGISRMMKEWAMDCGRDIMVTFDTLSGMETEPCNLCDTPQPKTTGIFDYLYEIACDIVAEATGHADERDMAIFARDDAAGANCLPNPSTTERKLSQPMTGLRRDENGELTLDPDAPDGVLFDNTANFEARFEGGMDQSHSNIYMLDPREFQGPAQRDMFFLDQSNTTEVPDAVSSREAAYRVASHEIAVRVASEMYQAALAEEASTMPTYEESLSPFSEESTLSGQSSPENQWMINGEWNGKVSGSVNTLSTQEDPVLGIVPPSVDGSPSQMDQWFESQELPSTEDALLSDVASAPEEAPSVIKTSPSEDDQFFESEEAPISENFASSEQPPDPQEDPSFEDASEGPEVPKTNPPNV